MPILLIFLSFKTFFHTFSFLRLFQRTQENNIQTRAQQWNACYKPEQHKIFKEGIHVYSGQVKRGIPAVRNPFSGLNKLLLLSNHLPRMPSSFSSLQMKSWRPDIWSLEPFHQICLHPLSIPFQELEKATLSSCNPEQGMQDTQNRIGQVQSMRLSP